MTAHPLITTILAAHGAPRPRRADPGSAYVMAAKREASRNGSLEPRAIDMVAAALRGMADLMDIIEDHYAGLPRSAAGVIDASPVQGLEASTLRHTEADMWEG